MDPREWRQWSQAIPRPGFPQCHAPPTPEEVEAVLAEGRYAVCPGCGCYRYASDPVCGRAAKKKAAIEAQGGRVIPTGLYDLDIEGPD